MHFLGVFLCRWYLFVIMYFNNSTRYYAIVTSSVTRLLSIPLSRYSLHTSLKELQDLTFQWKHIYHLWVNHSWEMVGWGGQWWKMNRRTQSFFFCKWHKVTDKITYRQKRVWEMGMKEKRMMMLRQNAVELVEPNKTEWGWRQKWGEGEKWTKTCGQSATLE